MKEFAHTEVRQYSPQYCDPDPGGQKWPRKIEEN